MGHRLEKALTALDRGQLDKALREIEQAAAAVGEPSTAGAEAFAARTARDLDMYGRWVDTALKR